MLDLTKTNLVLTAGRQIFFLIIGALILSFGLIEKWPKNNVSAMVQSLYPVSASVNVSATTIVPKIVPTIANMPKPNTTPNQALSNPAKSTVLSPNEAARQNPHAAATPSPLNKKI
jgi:hypothetical protein